MDLNHVLPCGLMQLIFVLFRKKVKILFEMMMTFLLLVRCGALNHLTGPFLKCVETTVDTRVTGSDYPQSQVKLKYNSPPKERRSGIILPVSWPTTGVEASIGAHS